MIYKSYLLEKILILLKNIVLFYGENLGLKNEFKEKLNQKNKNVYNLNTSKMKFLKIKKIFFKITNKSLFEKKNHFYK